MNVLFLTPQIPYPPHSGGRIVTWNTIKRFSKHCDVRVVSLYHHPDELAALEEMKKYCNDAAAFPAFGKWSLLPMLRSLLSTQPYKAHRFYNAQMAGYLQQLMMRNPIDIVHAQNFYTAKYVRPNWNVLKIHYKENVEGNVLLRYAKASSNPLKKWALLLEGYRTRQYERYVCRRFDHVLSISPLDRDVLNRIDPALHVRHQRPGVDIDEYPYWEEVADHPTLVFTGTLSYYPNVDGVLYFLRNGWQKIKHEMPNAQFYIVGSNPPDKIKTFHNTNGITVTGRVDDIQPYIKKAHVYVVPLRVGGGIRLKILEAMANGRAIVSTPVGCEGLDGKHLEHLLIGDMPDEFTNHILHLLKNDAERQSLRIRARQLAETVYDWDKVVQDQVSLYQTWLKEHQRSKGSI